MYEPTPKNIPCLLLGKNKKSDVFKFLINIVLLRSPWSAVVIATHSSTKATYFIQIQIQT